MKRFYIEVAAENAGPKPQVCLPCSANRNSHQLMQWVEFEQHPGKAWACPVCRDTKNCEHFLAQVEFKGSRLFGGSRE